MNLSFNHAHLFLKTNVLTLGEICFSVWNVLLFVVRSAFRYGIVFEMNDEK